MKPAAIDAKNQIARLTTPENGLRRFAKLILAMPLRNRGVRTVLDMDFALRLWHRRETSE